MNYTKGHWKLVKSNLGNWAIDAGKSKPIFEAKKPNEYYTDYPRHKDRKGREYVSLSEEQAKRKGLYVATPEIKERIENEEKANARLIAAAPDMYETLEELVDWIKQGDYEEKFLEKAENALKKAKGES